MAPGTHFIDGRWWKYQKPHQRQAAVERTCEVCLKPFIAREQEVKKGGGRFCSNKCAAVWQGLYGKGQVARCADCGSEHIVFAELVDR